MTVDIPEPVAQRLAAEAARRGVAPDELAVETLAEIYGEDDPLEAFLGGGDSKTTEPIDIHQLRADAAIRKLAEGA